jgi:tRNA1Val (adenine37-N6)-methyltransferase
MLKQKEASAAKPFVFKQFKIHQDRCAMKVGTDGVLLGAWTTIGQAQKMLDVGTGTGVIAVMLAQRAAHTEGVVVHAVEIDETALKQAQENMTDSPFGYCLTGFHDSIQSFAKNAADRYDLIVSNPPFFTGGTLSSSADVTNVRHTVKLPHGDLLNATRELLAKNGRFAVILPLIEGMRFIEIARTYGFFNTRKTEVKPRTDKPIERLLLEFEMTDKPLVKTELVLMNSGDDRDYTDQYKQLTKDFYTIF